MLLNDGGPIERRCPRIWSVGTLAVAATAILAVAGLRADVSTPDDPKPALQQPATAKAEPNGETLHYSGTVKDQATGKPIPGATVVVRREVLAEGE